MPVQFELADRQSHSSPATDVMSTTQRGASQPPSSSWLLPRGFLDDITGGGDDPRVGSGREGSDGGGTVSQANSSKSDSLSKLGGTFVPVAILFGVCLLLFLALRPRLKRVYAPRTIASLRAPERASTELPKGIFKWIKPFIKTPDTQVLNHGSLDGFFFLRYLKVLRNICLVGCVITWPVLLPLHATGHAGKTELDLLTMGNISNPDKFYAHVFVSWLFFGFILFTIVRECIYYINLRQAYLSSPYFSERLSSRTIMLTSVPDTFLDERRLRKLYGDSAKRIWIPRSSKALARMVKEREQTAERLEKAEIELIKKANLARRKYFRKSPSAVGDVKFPAASQTEFADEKGLGARLSVERSQSREGSRSRQGSEQHPSIDVSRSEEQSRTREGSASLDGLAREMTLDSPTVAGEEEVSPPIDLHANKGSSSQDVANGNAEEDDEDDDDYYSHPYGLDPRLPDLRGSVAAQWIKAESRPHHRPIGNYGRRVDTIRWTRFRLKDLNLAIHKMRRRIRRGDAGTVIRAAFIEFDTQEAAQAAHQVVAHHRPLQMAPRLLGIRPDEVVWASLRMSWWGRIGRRFLIMCLISAAVIFWSIPSAAVAIVANVKFLQKIPFLIWIKYVPGAIMGFVQGLIPPLALSLFMAIVPWMLRGCARVAGVPSLVLIELFSQNAYFVFQVVQVFLITTLTQAASGSLITILQDPLGAREVLAKNLPTASNFYLSYILVQCLASGCLGMLHPFELIRHVVLPRITQIPRTKYRVWYRLRVIHWGGVFPVFSNMGVIAFCYACIAPLILIFAGMGMWFTHAVWKYNLLYVFDSHMDSKGLFYPRALLHLTIGLYMAQFCLIGLFGLNLAYGPLALQALFFVFTGLVHMSLREAIGPLLQNLPQTLKLEEEIQEEEREAAARAQEERTEDPDGGGAAASYFNAEETFGEEEDMRQTGDWSSSEEENEDDEHGPVTGQRGVEGASDVRSTLTAFFKAKAKTKMQTRVEESGISRALNKVGLWNETKQRPQAAAPPSWLTRWLHPEIYDDFVALRKSIPADSLPEVAYPESEEMMGGGRRRCGYLPPEMWAPKPTLWIPRDEARVSRQEVAHTRLSTPISDRGATLDEKGRLVVDLDAAPFKEARLVL